MTSGPHLRVLFPQCLRSSRRYASSVASRPTPQATETLPQGALEALDAATRAIAGVLDLDVVLQLIVERVCDLADARYAALGIVDTFLATPMTEARYVRRLAKIRGLERLQ